MTDAPISAGTLFYLWGDKVLPPATRMLKRKVTLPSGAAVESRDLAALVFAVSIWNLGASGALRLERARRRSMGVLKTDDVGLTLGDARGPRDGYEDAVMGVVAQGKSTAHAVVRAWFRHDVSSPDKTVFRVAREEIPRHGLGREAAASGGGITAVFKSGTELQVDPDAVSRTWTEFSRLQAGWQSFATSDPLAPVLLQSCRKAIASRQESSE